MNAINFDKSIMQLVSYPRTGSHYVRIVIEDITKRPCAPTSFLGFDKFEPWGFHLHDRIVGNGDEGITSGFDKVIYLYRNPVDTIYSHIKYQNESDWRSIAEEYKNHLMRWLYNNHDCKKMIFVNYDILLDKPIKEFKRILEFMDFSVNDDDLQKSISRTTISRVRALTEKLDNKVVSQDHFNGQYLIDKSIFISENSEEINKMFQGIYK
jgi:hypothetical protein